MTPGQTRKADTYIEIIHPVGGERYPAHIFDLEDGIAWIEFGWADDDPLSAPSNPVHAVRGNVEQTSDGQWQIQTKGGLVTLRTLSLGKDPDEDLITRMKDMPEGNRDAARAIIEGDLDMTIPTQP